MNQFLTKSLKKLIGISRDENIYLLQVGNELTTGSQIILVFLKDQRYPRAVVKLPRYPNRTRLHNEWNMLNELLVSGYSNLEFMPEPMCKIYLENGEGYIYRSFPGYTLRSLCMALRPSAARKLILEWSQKVVSIVASLHSRDLSFLPATAMAEITFEAIEVLVSMNISINAKIIGSWCKTIELLGRVNSKIPLGLVHGDFSPYNLIINEERRRKGVGLVDWEYSEKHMPLLYDIFRFISTSGLLIHRQGPPSQRLLAISAINNSIYNIILPTYLDAIGLPELWVALKSNKDLINAFWLSFWLNAAVTEQQRSNKPSEVVKEGYLQGLIEIGKI